MIEFDNEIAASEGWIISDCHGSKNGPWQLQRLDEVETFKADEIAWLFVFQKALKGSAYHKAAFEFLKANNPLEIQAMEKFFSLRGLNLKEAMDPGEPKSAQAIVHSFMEDPINLPAIDWSKDIEPPEEILK